MSGIGDIVLPDSFDTVPHADVLRSERLLGALWSSADPTIDVRTGALLSLVLRPFASLLEVSRGAFQSAGRQSDLGYLTSASAVQDMDLVDAVARNYRISRKVGGSASGTLRMVFSRRMTVSIGPMDIFTANGMEFRPLQQFTSDARTEYPGTGPQMYPMPDDSGYVYFDLTVSAIGNGAAGNLPRGTEVMPIRTNIPFFIRAFVTETFAGGSDDESNHDLIQRMIYGISAKVLSSRTNMQASLLEVFPNIRDSSIIGTGDMEMTRDKHTVFPGSTGGYADWYVATSKQLQTATYEFEQFQLMGGEYVIRLLDEDFPGLYWVTEILDAATNSLCHITRQEKFKADADGRVRLFTDEEAMFSAYQMTEIRFTGQPDLKRVKVSGAYMPQIKEIQDWLLRCGQSPVGLDILVKGATPVTVKFGATLNIPAGAEVDFIALQNRVADHINGLPFDGVLSVSGLISILHSLLPEGSYVSNPSLLALQYIRDIPIPYYVRDRLVLNDTPFGTNKTSICYCDPADISLSHQFLEGRC